jgi:hypothetical protein
MYLLLAGDYLILLLSPPLPTNFHTICPAYFGRWWWLLLHSPRVAEIVEAEVLRGGQPVEH